MSWEDIRSLWASPTNFFLLAFEKSNVTRRSLEIISGIKHERKFEMPSNTFCIKWREISCFRFEKLLPRVKIDTIGKTTMCGNLCFSVPCIFTIFLNAYWVCNLSLCCFPHFLVFYAILIPVYPRSCFVKNPWGMLTSASRCDFVFDIRWVFPRNKRLADLNLKSSFEKNNGVTKMASAIYILIEFQKVGFMAQ